MKAVDLPQRALLAYGLWGSTWALQISACPVNILCAHLTLRACRTGAARSCSTALRAAASSRPSLPMAVPAHCAAAAQGSHASSQLQRRRRLQRWLEL